MRTTTAGHVPYVARWGEGERERERERDRQRSRERWVLREGDGIVHMSLIVIVLCNDSRLVLI